MFIFTLFYFGFSDGSDSERHVMGAVSSQRAVGHGISRMFG